MTPPPNGAPGLILDLTRTVYLDSRGVQLLVELAERLRGRQQCMRAVVPEGSLLYRVLRLSHIETVVPIDQSVEESATNLVAQ